MKIQVRKICLIASGLAAFSVVSNATADDTAMFPGFHPAPTTIDTLVDTAIEAALHAITPDDVPAAADTPTDPTIAEGPAVAGAETDLTAIDVPIDPAVPAPTDLTLADFTDTAYSMLNDILVHLTCEGAEIVDCNLLAGACHVINEMQLNTCVEQNGPTRPCLSTHNFQGQMCDLTCDIVDGIIEACDTNTIGYDLNPGPPTYDPEPYGPGAPIGYPNP